jgi:hypothetical protein
MTQSYMDGTEAFTTSQPILVLSLCLYYFVLQPGPELRRRAKYKY